MEKTKNLRNNINDLLDNLRLGVISIKDCLEQVMNEFTGASDEQKEYMKVSDKVREWVKKYLEDRKQFRLLSYEEQNMLIACWQAAIEDFKQEEMLKVKNNG